MSGKKEENRALGVIKKSISSYSVRWRMGQCFLRSSAYRKVETSRSLEGQPAYGSCSVTSSVSLSAIRMLSFDYLQMSS